MKNLSVCFFVLLFFNCYAAAQHTFYVNNVIGNDAYTGLIDTLGLDGMSGPKKTIANAALAANAGDSIKIVFTNVIYTESNVQVSKNLNFYAYGTGDIIIDFSAASTGFKFTMPGTTTFSSAGSQRFILRGSAHVGFNLVSGRVFLSNSTFIIQPPFLFQNDIIITSADPVTTWFVNSQTGNFIFTGLSLLAAPPNGPLPNIFHVYSKIPSPFVNLDNDLFNITPGEYTDAPVILKNITINGQPNMANGPVIFNLANTDLHFSMPGRTVFQWQNNNNTSNIYRFNASENTGMVFKSGCVEFRDVPVEIQPPFLFKRIPSYCDVDPPNINPIPLVVYGEDATNDRRVYHTIGIYPSQPGYTRCWLKENLNIGAIVQDNGFVDQTDNNVIEKYCYVNQLTSCDGFGGLYQWAEALQYYGGANNDTCVDLTGPIRGICPPDWHLPAHDEYAVLADQSAGGNTLKSIGVGSINTTNGHDGRGTNITGFSALMAGWRNPNILGPNTDLWNQWGSWTAFWSTTQHQTAQAWVSWLIVNDFQWGQGHAASKRTGLSVRCIHNTWLGSAGSLYTDVFENGNGMNLPIDYTLLQNYPNPFNPSTTIVYEVPKLGKVKIEIYDVTGRIVKELINKDETPGKHSVIWDGKDSSGRLVSSGMYLYNIKYDGLSKTRKMILLR